MKWEAFGSREMTLHTPWLPPPHYIVTARCVARCHAVRMVFDANPPASVWDAFMGNVEARLREVHPA